MVSVLSYCSLSIPGFNCTIVVGNADITGLRSLRLSVTSKLVEVDGSYHCRMGVLLAMHTFCAVLVDLEVFGITSNE